jgi:tocopherol O-methyltransferase
MYFEGIIRSMDDGFNEVLGENTLKSKIRKLYDSGSQLYLDAYGENIHDGYYVTGEETASEAQEYLVKLLAEKAQIKPGSKILDVGCGVGGSSLWLAKNLDAITTGITISPVQARLARALVDEAGANSKFEVMDAERMHFDEKFDVIWVVAAITHFPAQEKFIKSASRYLKPTGKFVIFDWMAADGVKDTVKDRYLKPVSRRMLLAGLFPMKSYAFWLKKSGHSVTYAEDITTHTIKTWSDAFLQLKHIGPLRLAKELALHHNREIFGFLRSFGAMKKAISKGRLKAGVIIAEKL